MISTRWFQGKNNIKDAVSLRQEIFAGELKLINYPVHDMYDEFAFNVVIYDDVPAGTGRLLFKEGRYHIDNVCVVKKFRGLHYGDLIVRMLVRRAVNMGADETYAEVGEDCVKLFKNIGFETVQSDCSKFLMVKRGDVGGSCCKH